jgi:hypothetical protein
VGLSCEGFEDELSVNRGNHKLKRLACSMNYGNKGGHSLRVIGKGKGSNCSL